MAKPDQAPKGGLGTFAGVFTPSILTILGIILFLRLGYVVGRAGLIQALIIIGVANLISVLTSFSLAAIATNMKVKKGGDYYLISRTLGIEFGGAIGLVLFLAQSVSIAFYCIGFGESVALILGLESGGIIPQLIAGVALLALFGLAWQGADLATKFQFFVMAFLVLALFSFYAGGITAFDSGILRANLRAPESWSGFWPLFALFFPAVTGFTQGVSMSGDLKDPGQSLPFGTFAAVGLSILVYVSVAVVFAGSSPLESMATDYGVMQKTALFGPLIDAGVIAATLSSAMASFLGAPRILQSLASDQIFPFLRPFAKGSGKSDNPRRGVLFSFAIALFTITLGQLDLVAGVVSMFFLISYGLLNYATYFEANTQSPSFRPRFRYYHRFLSLAGALCCLVVMLAIDLKTGLAAAAVLMAIYQYLKRTSGPSRWADSNRSHHLAAIRENLLATQEDLAHPRDWRPFIIALAQDGERAGNLVSFARLIEGRSGITTVVTVVEAEGYKALKLREAALKALNLKLQEKGGNAFALAVDMADLSTGLPVLFQSFGIGPIKANTLLFPWDASHSPFGETLSVLFRSALRNRCNVVVVDVKEGELPRGGEEGDKIIDVWWLGNDSSRLAILLAYLMTRNSGWDEARIRLLAFGGPDRSEVTLDNLAEMLQEIRIEAEPMIVENVTAKEIIKVSGQAGMVFLPVRLKETGLWVQEGIDARQVVPHLQMVGMTLASEPVVLDTEPEAGRQGELAMLMDELKHAEKRVAAAEKKAMATARAAAEMMDARGQEKETDPVVASFKEAMAARQVAKKASEKASKERAKLNLLTDQAREEGIWVPPED